MCRNHDLIVFCCGLLVVLGAGCPNGTQGTKSVDDDADGYEPPDDCDDSDPDVNPSATEDCSDGIDNDCDGVVDSCATDLDGDGYDVPDDCDDSDPAVHPDAIEDCFSGVDDNCDHVVTECLDAPLVYDPSSPGAYDSYGVAVFANTVVFGDPSLSGPIVGDGQALFFELEVGVVDQLDAVLTSDGVAGEEGGYGIRFARVGDALCISADYQDDGTNAVDAGKSWCFDQTTVEAAVGTLALTDATYTVSGEDTSGYAIVEAEADVDGDALPDLLVYSSKGMHVILGDGTPWSGDHRVPTDADLTLGACASSTTGWCGFARASNGTVPITLALSEEGGSSDAISMYTLPLLGGSTVPTASANVERYFGDSATGVDLIEGSAFGNSLGKEVVFFDGSGAVAGVLTGPGTGPSFGNAFGYWTETFFDQGGHELLLVSDTDAPSPSGGAMGVVYVYDLTADGLPTDYDSARYQLLPPWGYFGCGWRARGGIVTDDDGSSTTVVISCPGHGGAAYVLDHRPPPPPPVGPAAIYSTGENQYAIRQWVVDAYTSRIEWIMGLTQTELVSLPDGTVVGWRLHGITQGSPLYRAGLRSNDVLRRINGIDVSSPAVVRALYDGLKDATELTMGITRSGTPRLLQYAIVP